MNYKAIAKEKLKGKWGAGIGVSLIYGVITYLIGLIGETESIHYSVGLILNLLSIPLAVGLAIYFLKLVRDEENISDLFIAYKDLGLGLSYMLLSFLVGLIVSFGLLLFIIPGIIWSYSFKYVLLIKYDNPDMDIIDALKISNEMMKGRKMDAFLLDLSFTGWYILGILALFIGVKAFIIGVIPFIIGMLAFIIGIIPVSVYHQVAMTEFYENVRESYFGVKNNDIDYVYMEETIEVENEEVDYEGELTEKDIVSGKDTDSNLY